MVEIYKKIRYVKFNFIYTGFYMFFFLGLIFLLNLEGDIFEKVGYNNNKNNNNNNILSTAWANEINGTNNSDNITGTQSKDIIKGLNGNDTITGKEAGDDISGGSGDYILIGGSGNDTFTGGIGRDVFICSTGNDTITDFNITQSDTTPQQNDCEKIRYDNTDYYISFQQKQEDKQYEEAVDRSVHIENTIEDEKYEQKKSGSNNGFFFGLFK